MLSGFFIMAKSDKIIEEIGVMLSKGEAKAKVLADNVARWRISSRTFDRYWVKANEKAKQTRKAIDQVLNDTLTEETVAAFKEGLKSDLELEVILCQIATNNAQVEEWIAGEKIMRGVLPGEIIAAVREIWKKRGSYAPVKNALTNKDGDDIKSFEITLKL